MRPSLPAPLLPSPQRAARAGRAGALPSSPDVWQPPCCPKAAIERRPAAVPTADPVPARPRLPRSQTPPRPRPDLTLGVDRPGCLLLPRRCNCGLPLPRPSAASLSWPGVLGAGGLGAEGAGSWGAGCRGAWEPGCSAQETRVWPRLAGPVGQVQGSPGAPGPALTPSIRERSWSEPAVGPGMEQAPRLAVRPGAHVAAAALSAGRTWGPPACTSWGPF